MVSVRTALLAAAVSGVMAFRQAGRSGQEAVSEAVSEADSALKWMSVKISKSLEFSCIKTNACGRQGAEPVLMVHGFPERKEFWKGLMKKMDQKGGYCGVACDMHGYSPKASPNWMGAYHNDKIRKDTFAIATKVNFTRFHLVTHDHGSVLGWRMAGASGDPKRILSFTAMAIPHLDSFSKALYGSSASKWQQAGSQYFTTFVLNNSANLAGGFWFKFQRCAWNRCLSTAKDVQKLLWWYNGVFNDGKDAKLAMPPVMQVKEIEATDYPGKQSAMYVRSLFPGMSGKGFPATEKVGKIAAPTLFICGTEDMAIPCSLSQYRAAYARTNYFSGSYKQLKVVCGHNTTACSDNRETEKVLEAVLQHLDDN